DRGDHDRADRGGVHLFRGVRRARPAPDHGQLRASPGWPQRVYEPELVPAAQAQHGGRDSGDLRLVDHHVPGHGDHLVRPGRIGVIMIALIVAVFTYFVVFVERGQRRITVNYARRQGGRNAYMNQSSFLPLKLNMAGVIPAIFASSIIMFPATATTWFGQAGSAQWLQRVAQALSPGEPLYILLYAGLIAGFAFFYTALVFNSQETADNLKKSGALVPGIRPGKATAEYIDGVLTRL